MIALRGIEPGNGCDFSAMCLSVFQQARHHPPTPIPHAVLARAEPFNEGAAQVKRLVQRDRKEFLGNNVDILDQYTTEFGDVGPRKDGQRPDPGSTVNQKPSPAPAASTAVPASQPSSSSQPSTSKCEYSRRARPKTHLLCLRCVCVRAQETPDCCYAYFVPPSLCASS